MSRSARLRGTADQGGAMTVQLIRSATVLVRYRGEGGDDVGLLIDPLLGTQEPSRHRLFRTASRSR